MRPCRNPKCGKMFEPVSEIHSFCSDHCRHAVRGSEYRKARAVALYRDAYTCTECGETGNLQCHHILALYRGGNNRLDNLQILCRQCHRAKHKTWKEVIVPNEQGEQGEPRGSEVYHHAA